MVGCAGTGDGGVVWRVDDVCAGVADGQLAVGDGQCGVFVVLFVLLQHAVGMGAGVDSVGVGEGVARRVCEV